MIYFIHDETNRTIKIGHGWNPKRRLSTLQISNSSTLVLLGKIGGTKKVEKEIHWLVRRHDAANPADPGARPLNVSGEWFDDRVLPFVREVMTSPKAFLKPKEKKPPRTRHGGGELRTGSLTLKCDSGETFRETFTLNAATAELALHALANVAAARLRLLADSFRVTRLAVPGLARDVDLPGVVATACNPRHGLAVVLNTETGGGRGTLDGIRQYAQRWLHGVPPEFYQPVSKWFMQPTPQCLMLLSQFAQALNQNRCVVVAQTVLLVRDVLPDGIGRLPKGELRSKVNQKAATKRRVPPAGEIKVPKSGMVYFIQDTVTTAIKIGFCLKKPEKRLAELQVGNSNRLLLVGHTTGTETTEKSLHKHFKTSHRKGEWFTSDILQDVHDILKARTVEQWLMGRASTTPMVETVLTA